MNAVLQAHDRQHLQGDFRSLLAGLAPDPQRHGNVVERAELGQQMVKLVDKTQVLVAQLTLLGW